MKQLPQISAALYGMPWAILPQNHIELGQLYHAYVHGNLPTPQAVAAEGTAGNGGIEWECNHAEGIALVHLNGVITKRAPRMLCGPSLIDLSALDILLDELAADAAIETVVFNWNTPGGMMIGLEETCERMREIAAEKRLISYTDYQCCSAGYYLATASDEIYAAPSAAIGSIGIYVAGLDDSRAWEMEGMKLILAKSGSLKAMGHPGKEWTEEEREWLQNKADIAGQAFRDQVTGRRSGVPDEAMQGQWFFAKEAPSQLIDGFYRDIPALLADIMKPASV
jgi:signal peptide peptidase SppA